MSTTTTEMAEWDELMQEWEAEKRLRATRVANENGYATSEEYKAVRHKQFDDLWEACKGRNVKKSLRHAGSGCGSGSSNEDSGEQGEPEKWFYPERCNCEGQSSIALCKSANTDLDTEHFLGVFCPGNLKELPGSMEGWLGEYRRSRQPDLRDMTINERKPSRRLPDQHVHRLWSLDSEDEQNQEPLPIYFKQDRVVQEILAKPKGICEVSDNNVNLHQHAMESHQQSVSYSIPSNEPIQRSALSEDKRSRRLKLGGKGTIKGGASKNGQASQPPRVTNGAPSMKKKRSKDKEGGVTPPWLRSFLEQPRQTRSKDCKILVQLNAQSQVVAASPRRS